MTDWSATLLMVMSVAAGWLGAMWVLRHADRLKLVSVPNQRSSHVQPTPHGGGLGIVLGGSIVGAWLAWGESWALGAMAGLALLLAMVGLVDDIRSLPARVRFLTQLLVVASLLWLADFHNNEGWMMFGLLLFAGVWWINLFNFMDGIDGLAGAQAIFMLLAAAAIGALFHPEVASTTSWLWMLNLSAATVGFLLLNWPPARIFMGDVGSTYLAFLIFGLAVTSVREGWMNYSAWIILAAVFVTDATVTLLRRILAGERWFEAHRSHVYQRMTRRFGSHRPVTLIVSAVNTMWLFPFAWASVACPSWAWIHVFMAYLPLGVMALILRAGVKDHA